MSQPVDAVVVGSGPNGLAAAVTLARAGLSITVLEGQPTPGGGVRTMPLVTDRVAETEALLRDVCAAVPAAAPHSRFFAEFDLAARGVELIVPEASYAQPLAGGRAGIAWRDIDRTVAGLGQDGPLWSTLLRGLSEHPAEVSALALSDKRGVPPGGSSMALAGVVAAFARAVAVLGTRAGDFAWRGDLAPALITGVMAHTNAGMPTTATAGSAAYLASLAHAERGWPLVRGGIGEITGALIEDLLAHGGQVLTGHPVGSRADLPPARSYLFDTHAHVLAPLLGEPYRSRLLRLGRGGAVCKLDYVLRGPVPWAHPDVARAGTVHVGGTVQQMRHSQAEVAAGRHADQPMLLVSDPATHDPGRLGRNGLRPLWSYAQVPHGSTLDVRDAVDAQLERYAPGFGDLVVDALVTPAAEMSRHNAAYPGGDISGGAITLWRMLARPSPSLDPYAVAPGVWLCSQSTPPGPGVHGMCGWNAARRVLRTEFGIASAPSLAPQPG